MQAPASAWSSGRAIDPLLIGTTVCGIGGHRPESLKQSLLSVPRFRADAEAR